MDKFVLWIGRVMIFGLICALVLLIYGGVLYFMQHAREVVHLEVFRPEPKDLDDMKSIFSGALLGNSLQIMQLGVLAVVFGQVFRILLTMFLFIYEKDALFAFITFVIFMLAAHSFFVWR